MTDELLPVTWDEVKTCAAIDNRIEARFRAWYEACGRTKPNDPRARDFTSWYLFGDEEQDITFYGDSFGNEYEVELPRYLLALSPDDFATEVVRLRLLHIVKQTEEAQRKADEQQAKDAETEKARRAERERIFREVAEEKGIEVPRD